MNDTEAVYLARTAMAGVKTVKDCMDKLAVEFRDVKEFKRFADSLPALESSSQDLARLVTKRFKLKIGML